MESRLHADRDRLEHDPFILLFGSLHTEIEVRSQQLALILSLQIITTCGHKVGWLIAKKSWDRMVIGFFARAMACIPVTRPQVRPPNHG